MIDHCWRRGHACNGYKTYEILREELSANYLDQVNAEPKEAVAESGECGEVRMVVGQGSSDLER